MFGDQMALMPFGSVNFATPLSNLVLKVDEAKILLQSEQKLCYSISCILKSCACPSEKLRRIQDYRSHLSCFSSDEIHVNARIEVLELTIPLISDRHSLKPNFLCYMAVAYGLRLENSVNLEDMDKAIHCFRRAADLVLDTNPIKAVALREQGTLHCYRYGLSHEFQDLSIAIQCYEKSASLTSCKTSKTTPFEWTELAKRMGLLGEALSTYSMQHSNNLSDIEKAMQYSKKAMKLTVDCSLSNRDMWYFNVGCCYYRRAELSLDNRVDNTNNAIKSIQQSVSLTPQADTDLKIWRMVMLGCSHLQRHHLQLDSKDVEQAIRIMEQALSLSVTSCYAASTVFNMLGRVYQARSQRNDSYPDIKISIKHHKQALAKCGDTSSDKAMYLYDCGSAQTSCYFLSGKIADLDEAVTSHIDAVKMAPAGHHRRSEALGNLATTYCTRFNVLQNAEDIDKAIQAWSQVIPLVPEFHWNMPWVLVQSAMSHIARYQHFQWSDAQEIMTAIDQLSHAASLSTLRPAVLKFVQFQQGMAYLARFCGSEDLEDACQAIKYSSQAIELHEYGPALNARHLHNLAAMHMACFIKKDDTIDLDAAIKYCLRAISLLPDSDISMARSLRLVSHAYKERYVKKSDLADITEAIKLNKKAAHLPLGSPFDKFSAACGWAQLSSEAGVSPLPGWERAVALLPEVIWIGSVRSRRYKEAGQTAMMILEAAATAIKLESYKQAIEWLEAGRSVVWGQILQFRASFDQIYTVNPQLATKLEGLARYLDLTTFSETNYLRHCIDVRTTETTAQHHRDQANKWGDLLNEARNIPSFHDFLKPKSFNELSTIAQRFGTVVIINTTRLRCDALVILPTSSIICIPLTMFSYNMGLELQSKFSDALTYSNALRHSENKRKPLYMEPETGLNQKFEEVLSALWKCVAEPILRNLGYLAREASQGLPHVTWCTNGALSSLPIHAAGCYNGSGDQVYKHVISSYTTTLTALLKASPASCRPAKGVLAIGKDLNLPGTIKELQEIERLCHSKGVAYKRLEGSTATPDSALKEMKHHSWIHFACHASQGQLDPAKSAFHLHGGSLDMASLMKEPLKEAQLAFLSACETATGDKHLPDEAVHLAGGMLTAGFSTVIATMWSIQDDDAVFIAKEFYDYVLQRENTTGTSIFAMALHIAMRRLQHKVGEKKFERWVPFIHLGS